MLREWAIEEIVLEGKDVLDQRESTRCSAYRG